MDDRVARGGRATGGDDTADGRAVRLSCWTGPGRRHPMKYVLLFVGTEEFEQDLEAMSPAERERAVQGVMEWMATHAGKIRGGNKLRAPETATTVRLDRGEPVITDGPF